MDEKRFTGAANQAGGKIESTIGDLTGDTKTQAQGYAKQASGAAERTYGQAKDAARNVGDKIRDQSGDYGTQILDQLEEAGDYVAEQVDERPITAMLVAAGVGFLIALATKPSRRSYRRH